MKTIGYTLYHKINLPLHLRCWKDINYYLSSTNTNTKTKTFNFEISKKHLQTYKILKFNPSEIIERLAFTVVDPFYDEFKEYRGIP